MLEEIDDIAHSSRQAEEEANIEMCDAMDHYIIHPAKHLHTRYDIGVDIGCGSDLHEEVVINNRLSDEEYRNIAQNLNKEKQTFFYHVLHSVKTTENPFYIFLSRVAGVGKSHRLKCLCQATFRYFDTIAGEN